MHAKRLQGGFSFVELIVTSAIAALVFGGLFASYETIISTIRESRLKANALALATERIEYIRSLPYALVGTVSGVPSGALPQTSTRMLNGSVYYERILISYVDDDADGLAGADTNAITSDYKLVKVEYSWASESGTSTIFHTTNIVPRGIETTAGGGTIRVNVFDATAQPVSGAEVRFVNTTGTSSIDTTRYTGVLGEAYLSGAPAGGGYQIYVTKSSYSSDGTYLATTSNPNPNPPVVSVLESQVSTMNFQIDEVGQLTIETREPPTYDSFEDQFGDDSQLAATSSVEVAASALTLSGAPGSYPSSGTASSVFVAPPTLYSWEEIDSAVDLPAGTTIRVFVYHDSASPTLVPDSDLPGNSAGFTTNPIDLSELDADTYPELAVGFQLETADNNVTPSVLEWELTYVADRAPIAGIPVVVELNKIIGADGAGYPVLKYSNTVTTNGSGEYDLNDMEWGTYTVNENSASYIASEVCPYAPYTLLPGTQEDIIVTLVPAALATMRVYVSDASGDPVPDATLTFSSGGYSDTQDSSRCGQVLFTTPAPGDAYDLTITKPSYASQNLSGITVATSGSAMAVTLVP